MAVLIRRATFLTLVMSMAVLAVACGRATEVQINQALGITPTATLSPEEIAEQTAAASATSAARQFAASSPGAAIAGDIVQGERQFGTWCSGCHGPGGIGPDILSPGSPGATVDPDMLQPLVREGEGHDPPGPFKPTEITDKQIVDLAAYIRANAGG
jgi:mono/diheme cytochrome c family protein